MGRGPFRYPCPLWLLYPAVLVSGFTALVYEIVWARRLALVLGSTTSAASAVLSAFMFGLAAGALLVGWRADASRRPLRWYGILELGLGIYALAFDSLLDVARGALAAHPWLCSFAILSLPAALMGGTLPVLARAAADTTQRGARAFGGLYGMNTLGAVVGALIAALVLLEALGLAGATRLAAVLNIALGAGFWGIAIAAGDRDVYAGAEEAPRARMLGDAEPPIVLAFFLAGFAALGLEMAWFRLLVYYLEGFTIAFGLMLAAYLLGLGAGALGGTWVALLAKNPRRLLARLLLAEGVLAVATFLLVTPLGDGLEAMRQGYRLSDAIDSAYKLRLFWMALAVVFPATFCAGMLMPVVARIALSDRETIALHTGVVYAASTFGAVLAPPVAAFWLLPALGAPKTIAVFAALILVAGTLVAFARGLREWTFAGGAAVLFVAACLAGGLGTPLVERSHVFRSGELRRLLHASPGELCDVAVVEEVGDGTRRLYLDGFSAAETGASYGYMRMQGHLPVLLHPDPRRVLVIAFGTGTTAGAVSVHPEVEEIVCVEIEPEVYAAASFFEAQNRKVLSDPRVRRVVGDGREYIGRGGKFDVITLEPLMPYTPAAVHFYTKEFYEQARAALNPGGILCQWIPPQGVSGSDLRRLLASVSAAFGYGSLWYFRDAVLVLGSDGPPRVNGQLLQERTTTPQERLEELQKDLRIAAVGDLAHLLGAHVVSGEELKKAIGDAAPITDDHPDLEFRPLARGLGRKSAQCHAEVLEFLSEHSTSGAPWLDEALSGTEPTTVELKRATTLALATGRAILDSLARERRYMQQKRRIRTLEEVDESLRSHYGPTEDGGYALKVPANAGEIEPLLRDDPKALFARRLYDQRRFEELMHEASRYASPEEKRIVLGRAAQLGEAPDRSRAYLALVDLVEGEARLYYLTLAVRQNALLEPRKQRQSAALLDELAKSLEGPERRFCENRARFMRGEAWEAGEERLPEVTLPEIRPALEAGDTEAARSILDRARQADLGDQVDKAAWEWFGEQEDKRAAFGLLIAIGSGHIQRAAGQLLKGSSEDILAVAPFYCERYPTMRVWADKLCRSVDVQVREAAADAAKESGTRDHLPELLLLCGDAEQRVRMSAFISFQEIEPRALQTGYNPEAPNEKALQALGDLVTKP